jgi:hypothetical protein
MACAPAVAVPRLALQRCLHIVAEEQRPLMNSARILFGVAALLTAALSQVQQVGAPNLLVPAGKLTSDAISSDGTDPKDWDAKLDALLAAPDNHRILYEDNDVRVLLVRAPRQKGKGPSPSLAQHPGGVGRAPRGRF